MQLLPYKIIKLNHIKEANIIQTQCFVDAITAKKKLFNQIQEAHDIETQDWKEEICFSVQLLPEKVLKMFHIGEALNIKVHITQKGGCFFSAASGEKSF